MTTYTFDPVIAYDATTGTVAKSASFVAYAIDDTSRTTPLDVTDVNGLALTIKSNGDGVLPTVRADDPQIVLVSGPYAIKLTAVESILADSQASRAAAEEARDAAQAATGGDGVASDDGIAALVTDPASDTSAALVQRYGPGIIVLDLDAPLPAGLPDDTLVARVGSGTPAVTIFAQDGFARTLSGDWGNAETGGTWSTSHPARFSTATTDGGEGLISVEATSAYRSANLASVIELDQEILATVSRETVGTGGMCILIDGRASGGGTTKYRATLRIYASTNTSNPGRVDLALGTGAGLNDLQDYSLGTLTGYTEGREIKVRLRIEGTNPTVVSARAWYADGIEPTTWTRQASNSAAAMQVAGQPFVSGYLTGSEGTLPQVISVRDFLMTGL